MQVAVLLIVSYEQLAIAVGRAEAVHESLNLHKQWQSIVLFRSLRAILESTLHLKLSSATGTGTRSAQPEKSVKTQEEEHDRHIAMMTERMAKRETSPFWASRRM